MNILKTKSRNRIPLTLGVLLAVLSFSLFLNSCNKEYFALDKVKDPVWNPTWAVPVINSTVTVPDILDKFDDDEIVVINSDGLLALRYYGNIFTLEAKDLVQLPDQNDQVQFTLTPGEIVTLGTSGVSKVLGGTYNFTTGGTESLKTIEFKGGTIDFKINSQLAAPGNAVISIPELRDAGGQSYNQTINFPANASNVVRSVSLVGYTMDLTRNNTTTNQIDVNLTVNFNSGGVASPLDVFMIDQDINGMEYALITGDLDTYTQSLPLDSVRIRLYENNTSGTITWADPKIRMFFTNSYGADLNVSLSTFTTSSRLNPPVPVTGITFPLNIQSSNTVLQSQLTTFELLKTNSNVAQVVNSSPTLVIYRINPYTVNPGPGTNNWIADTSRLRLDMQVEMPFDGIAADFTQIDTAELNIFPLSDDIEEIVSILIRVTVDNGLPLEGRAQAYFLDSNYVVIDSVFQEGEQFVILPQTPIMIGGLMRCDQTNKVRKQTDIVLDRELINKLENNGFRYLISKAVGDTRRAATVDVQIYKEYEMNLKIGIQTEFKYRIPLDSLRSN